MQETSASGLIIAFRILVHVCAGDCKVTNEVKNWRMVGQDTVGTNAP